MVDPRGEGKQRLEGEARERVEPRTTQPWAGDTGSGSSSRAEVERATDEAQRAIERGREAARARADKLVGRGSAQAVRWMERAAAALRDGASSLEQDESARVVADYVRRAAGGLDRMADELRHEDARGLIERAESMARRRPAVFLGGITVAGIALGRFLRSSSMRRQLESSAHAEPRHRTYGGEGEIRPHPPDVPDIIGPHAPPIAVDPAEVAATGKRSSR